MRSDLVSNLISVNFDLKRLWLEYGDISNGSLVRCYLFWKPRTEEGHVERVGVRMDGAEGIGTDGTNQCVNAPSQLVANFTIQPAEIHRQTKKK